MIYQLKTKSFKLEILVPGNFKVIGVECYYKSSSRFGTNPICEQHSLILACELEPAFLSHIPDGNIDGRT